MPELIPAMTRVHRSWLDALAEPEYEPRWAEDLDLTRLADPLQFDAYVAGQRAQAGNDTARPPGWVPATYLWYVDGSEFLGRLSIRHRLTPWLFEYGGHVGYDVRPSARRRGHATAMLQLALPWCRALGIEPALVTCDVDNIPSRRVIEHAGGQFEDERDGKLRFWVPTRVPQSVEDVG
ncbi:MAG: GNAT family N-acetyltransferase [Jiangellaceae bacterium]